MKSGKQWMKEVQDAAKEAFSTHEKEDIGPGHWRIIRPDSGAHWADIVVMGDMGLAVWGDIDGCFFAYNGSKNPEEIVAWIANADVEYYGRQKACIGMGSSELVDEFIDEVALYDLDQCLKQLKEEHSLDDWNCPRQEQSTVGETYEEAFEMARSLIACGEDIRFVQYELMEDVMNEDQDAHEWVFGIGKVTSSRVIFAMGAVARLHELLQAE